MTERWLAVRVEPSAHTQVVIDALFAAGAQGVQDVGSTVITHFPPDADLAAVE